jgi:hypothetical protein
MKSTPNLRCMQRRCCVCEIRSYRSPLIHPPLTNAAARRYDLFPITVEIKERRRSVGHFLTRVCAVVGGVFAVSGMLDRGVHALLTRLHPKR